MSTLPKDMQSNHTQSNHTQSNRTQVNPFRAPKYRQGQANVFYNAKRRKEIIESREELRKKFTSSELGESPLGRLTLYAPPFWDGKTWVYPYEYGCYGNHEGYAAEEDLEIIN